MTQFVRVEAATGRILCGVGRCDPADFAGVPDARPFPHDGWIYYAWQERVDFGAQPTPTSELRWVDGAPAWVETASLEDLKSSKRAEITAARLAADGDRFVYMDKEIRTADKDMFDLLLTDGRIGKCAPGTMPAKWPGGWKAIDNSYLPIPTREDWDAFYIAMYDAGIDNFNHSQELKAVIDQAETAEQVAAINW